MGMQNITTFIRNSPPVTLSLSIIVIVLSALTFTALVDPLSFNFSIFLFTSDSKLQRLFSVFRIFTSIFYFGDTFDSLIHIIFFIRYSKMLEESFLNSSEYLLIIISLISLLVSSNTAIQLILYFSKVYNNNYLAKIYYHFALTNFSQTLSTALTYIWTRRNPNVQVQLLGALQLPAFYLPFLLPMFTFVLERRIPKREVFGIFIGHLLYFIKWILIDGFKIFISSQDRDVFNFIRNSISNDNGENRTPNNLPQEDNNLNTTIDKETPTIDRVVNKEEDNNLNTTVDKETPTIDRVVNKEEDNDLNTTVDKETPTIDRVVDIEKAIIDKEDDKLSTNLNNEVTNEEVNTLESDIIRENKKIENESKISVNNFVTEDSNQKADENDWDFVSESEYIENSESSKDDGWEILD